MYTQKIFTNYYLIIIFKALINQLATFRFKRYEVTYLKPKQLKKLTKKNQLQKCTFFLLTL